MAIGIGRFQRGYERYFRDLFEALQPRMNVTLYKGAGPRSEQEHVPAGLGPAMAATRLLPLGRVGAEYRSYRHDCLAYGLTMLPSILRNNYDVIHVIDYPLAKLLVRLRHMTRFRSRLLFCNGCCMPPRLCPRVDHVQHISYAFYQDALAQGVPPSNLTWAPCGVQTSRYRTALTRPALRSKHGISNDTFVILAVTAVKRHHKRVDYIIEEVSRVEGDVLLWIDGSPEDPSVLKLASRRLGSRCRITCVPSNDVAELYNVADLMVHAALDEAFGLSIAEGMSTGLTVLTHDSDHFRWLVEDEDCLIDMRVPGALAARIRERIAVAHVHGKRSSARARRIHERFDWSQVAPVYESMYRSVAYPTQSAKSAELMSH